MTDTSREKSAGSTIPALKLGGSPAPSSGPFRLAHVPSARDEISCRHLEIKDKKGVENTVVDHLSHLQVTNMQELPINDFLHDDMLLKVTDTNPWYANIVNFMVSGYVPPGENKRKLQVKSRCHLWDDPYLYRVCSDGLLRRCVPMAEGLQIIEKCHATPYGGHYEAFRTQAKIW